MRIRPPDLEVWGTSFVRSALKAEGWDVEVDSTIPAELVVPLARPLVVVRVDSLTRASPPLFDAALGVSVLAGSRQDDRKARDLSALVFTILTDEDVAVDEATPVVDVDFEGCNGPYSIDDPLDVSRRYMTIAYTATGSW